MQKIFRIYRAGGGRPPRNQESVYPGDERILYGFEAPNGEKLGVQLNSDGSLGVGGWNEDGEWVDLVVRQPCTASECRQVGHSSAFPLDQFKESLE